MTTRTSATVPASPDRAGLSLAPATLLAVGVTVARLAYLRWICPYNLVEDEAHYWMWSRYLDWSYYSKGPGVAWAIWLSTRIFGNAEWAVRVPTALLVGLGTLAAAALARDLAARAWEMARAGGTTGPVPMATPRRVALMAAAAFAMAPALQMVGVLMTIDGPYVSLWAVACWLFWRAVERSSGRAWIGLGAAVAVGFLFKYTTLLLLPGLAIYALLRRGKLQPVRHWAAWFAAGSCIAALGFVPVIVWNATRDWPTVRHLAGRLRLPGGDMPVPHPGLGYVDAAQKWEWVWPLEFIGSQLGMIGPAIVLALIGGWIAIRRARAGGRSGTPSLVQDPRWPGQLFLICCAAPILAFYAVLSFIAEPEGNWPMAAYATLLPLAGWLAADAYQDMHDAERRGEPKPRRSKWMRALWRATIGCGVIGASLLHFAGVWTSAINRVVDTSPVQSVFKAATGREPEPVVVGRLFGAKEMAAEVGRLLEGLGHGRGDPFIITQHYGRASQMAYYLDADAWKGAEMGGMPQHGPTPDVLCAMAYTGGRKSQFDLWKHTSLDRPDLIGRDAIILSNNKNATMAVWKQLFESVEPIPGDSVRLPGEHKSDRVAFIGRRYLGPAGKPVSGRLPRSIDAAADQAGSTAKDGR